jgi:hypothetical protein
MYAVDVFSKRDSIQLAGRFVSVVTTVAPPCLLVKRRPALSLLWTTDFSFLSGNEMRFDTLLLQQQIFGVEYM